MKRVLLCPPTKFDVVYEINPWMHVEIKPERASAMEAYRQLCEHYKALGFEIYELEPQDGLPDQVYTANVGNVKNSTFIRANFKYDQRRRESDFAEDFFETKFDMDAYALPEDVFFEGQGDLLSDGERYFFGWGKRSDRAAIPYLEHVLNTRVIDFELIDPYYYHLDTCFAPLSTDVVVINPRSFTPEGRKRIAREFSTVIEANEADNRVLACNLVCAGKEIVLGKGITEELREKLAKFGYNTHEIDMCEYLKGGGSVKCCTFEF
ncbi:MAG: arginine deiminase-related protein [Patescibacteria group bacterium]|nr:arginine deiminase-related protein [Patescibacteria group bacterium]